MASSETLREVAADACFVIGWVGLIYGCYLVALPVSLIVGGLTLIALGVLLSNRRPP